MAAAALGSSLIKANNIRTVNGTQKNGNFLGNLCK